MADVIKRPNVRDIDVAVRLYYEKFELSGADIQAIFGAKSSSTVSKLKKIVREEMVKTGRLPYDQHNVATDVAFEAWGLDIADLERRRAKLMKLGGVREVAANV